MTGPAEPFSDKPDAEHPITWQPADGDHPQWLTLRGAVQRLEGYGYDEATVREHFAKPGRGPLRTPFAYYRRD